jgi:ABC-type branched-subunit amino acid transport system ATPase component
MNRESILAGEELRVHFDGVTALAGVDIEIRSKQILGLIGPNGAGKTTLLNVLSGFLPPTSGLVRLDGKPVPFDPVKLSRAGVVRTFQNVRAFGRLTTLDNVALGAIGAGMSQSEARDVARHMLDEVGIGKYADAPANALAHGEERLVGITRALAMRPRFLLLDEPAAGLNEAESRVLTDFLKGLPDQYGVGLLVVEHDMTVIMRLSARILVIDHGRAIALGTPTEIQNNDQVQEAYLGTRASHA